MPAVPPVDAGGPAPPVRPGWPRLWDGSDVAATSLPLELHRLQRRLPVGDRLVLSVDSRIGADRLGDLVVGGGFAPLADPVARPGGLVVEVERLRTLADSVGPGMQLLVCGVNPSFYSADAGVGYARPGNRFWPAALAGGVAPADRDPVAALGAGLGMTDFAKRATRTAAEVTREEYREGLARVTRLVRWLAPRAVCFVGLSGWRTVVDRRAVAGPQPTGIGGRPAYVMPSTSGLNARTPLTELAEHLAAAWALTGPPARSGRPPADRRRTGR